MNHRKLIILGSGAAGLTAAIYASRAGLSPLLITGGQQGGQLTVAGEVENYPGFAEAIDGADLTATMQEQAERVGTEMEYDTVVSVDLESRPFLLKGEAAEYSCDALIVSTGAKARWLGIEGESEYMGKGVSACATCDGFFFKGLDAVVVGGGNTAVEEALYLSKICRTVHVVHRRESLRAEAILQERLRARKNVTFHWNQRVEKIEGTEDLTKVGSVKLVSTLNGKEDFLATDAVFVAIGHDPVTQLFDGKVETFSGGYIKTAPGTTRTSVDGVFAAGDVADPIYRQAVTAAGMGCMAALDADRWLQNR
ncbi:thioredoxin-disulfide reductase [Sinorhizobium meliloti]|nr:thioredoxin-disulfide reductase [Sinorhizobium meliloti]